MIVPKNITREIARKSTKTVLKDYRKRKMDIEERIRQNMLAKPKKSTRKGTRCLKENHDNNSRIARMWR